MLDNAVLEVMARSVALAAFVEPPRDSAVVPAGAPRRAAREAEPQAGSAPLTAPGKARLTLGRVLAKAGAWLQGRQPKEPSPNDCLPA